MCVSLCVYPLKNPCVGGVGRWHAGRASLQGGVKEERSGTVTEEEGCEAGGGTGLEVRNHNTACVIDTDTHHI